MTDTRGTDFMIVSVLVTISKGDVEAETRNYVKFNDSVINRNIVKKCSLLMFITCLQLRERVMEVLCFKMHCASTYMYVQLSKFLISAHNYKSDKKPFTALVSVIFFFLQQVN